MPDFSYKSLALSMNGVMGSWARLMIFCIRSSLTLSLIHIFSKVTRDGIKEIRRSVSQLRPDALERFSLEYAISKMVSDMNAVSGARVYFDCQVKNLKFDEDEENAIYRVIQEGITNALRQDVYKRQPQEYDKGGITCDRLFGMAGYAIFLPIFTRNHSGTHKVIHKMII